MKLHIGNAILEILDKRGITKRNFARQINMGERNLYELFKRDSIDTAKLSQISKVLGYDFFQLYTNELKHHHLDAPQSQEEKKPESINVTFQFSAGENDEKSRALIGQMNSLLSEFIDLENRKEEPNGT